jgi:alpha-amylase
MLSILFIGSVLSKGYRPEALGPLNAITNWNQFAADLQRLKAAGVQAFATDVWWSRVELQDQQFDWSYYDQMSRAILDAGLKWIPILSTHQCGGEGQECNIPVPEWTGIKSNPKYQFVDVFGVANTESFSPWSGDYAYEQYDQFFAEFARHYAPLKGDIVRIDLSGGTSGELRFPSYSMNWTYPARGQLQAYSDAAVASFQEYAVKKYGSLAKVGEAWGMNLKEAKEILPPCDVTTEVISKGVCADKTGKDEFFSKGVATAYGKDFGEWYQISLHRHSERLSHSAHKHFDPVFDCTIAMKVAGIHWQYFHPTEARSAERSAGYWDYAALLKEFKRQRLEVTFTAIEMDDQNSAPNWSGAKSLTRSFYQLCKDLEADCGSENALPVTGPQGSPYKNMRQVLADFHIASLTFLRYNNLVGSIVNSQAYANYVSAVRENQKSLFIRVANVTVTPGQTLAVVGNIPELGNDDINKAFKLAPFRCNGSLCQWAGNVLHTYPEGSQVDFKIVLLQPNKRSAQCDSFSMTQTTRTANALINLGQGQNNNNGIQSVFFSNLTFCPVEEPLPTQPPGNPKCYIDIPAPTSSSSASVPEPTFSPEPNPDDETVFVKFEVTRSIPSGDALYVVGSLNDWATCDAIPCQANENVWNCGPVELRDDVRYEWKPIQFGSGSNATCEQPIWKDGANEVFTASKGLVVSLSF